MVNYYDKISSSYDKLYEKEQKNKLEFLKELISDYLIIKSNTKILDLGCGSGYSSDFPCFVLGIDYSKKLISYAKKRFETDKTKKFIYFDANDKLNFKDKEFDISLSLSAIHHINDLSKLLRELKRVTRYYIFLSFPKKFIRFDEIESNLINAVNLNKLELIFKKSQNVDMFYVIKVNFV